MGKSLDTRKAPPRIPEPDFEKWEEPLRVSGLPPHHGYTPTLARKICARIMQGETVDAITKSPGFPVLKTLLSWLADPRLKRFHEAYYWARRIQAELRVDEIFTIADDGTNDWKPKFDKHGEQIGFMPDQEVVQRSRLRVETRKWYAGKMLPHIYGEQTQVKDEVIGELASLLKEAMNKDTGLPKPVNDEK